MDLGIAGRKALITGSSQGIGLETARALLAEGVKVAICGRSREKLDRASEALGHCVVALQVDLNVSEERSRLIEEATRILGGLDILVNNAGGSLGGGGFQKSTEQQWREVFELNLFATLHLSKLALPAMLESGWGRVVNVASIWGKESGGGAAYNAAKASIISLTKAMATDLGSSGVLVNCVAPGSVLHTGGGWEKRQREQPDQIAEFVKREMPMQRFGSPEEVAAVIAFLCSERASLVNGACFTVDGAQSRSNL